MPNRPELKFPKNFLWGVTTSAHQIEGGQHNQWTVWELENAKTLAAQAPYQYDDLENWPGVKKQAVNPANYVSGKAANHYELYEQDIELARRMRMNAYRFSVEWSRIQPERDAWNAEAIEHYKSVLAALQKREIEPVVTLFHFTVPVWFAQLGGFERASNVQYFVLFAERILRELGPTVKYVITMHEPEVYAAESYLRGVWTPQIQNKKQFVRVIRNLAKAHNKVARIAHTMSRRYKVSVAKNSKYAYPGDDSWLSVRSAAGLQYFQDDYFLKRVIKNCDFIGVNYYQNARVFGYRVHNPDARVSDIGWDMQPEYIERALERLYEKYQKPLFVTENGVADGEDEYRQWWLAQTIMALQRSRDNGVELIGYLHNGLIDGFEWNKGFWPRYGLFAVDYKTYERTPRKSAVWLARVLKKIRT